MEGAMVTNTRMHWTVIVIIIAAIAVSSAGCTSNQSTQSGSASFLLYSNKDAGVEINYPSDWQLTGTPNANTIAKFEHGNENTLFLIQRSTLNKTGQTPQSISQQFLNASLKSNASVKVLENQSASLGGLPAYKTVITLTYNNQSYTVLTLVAIKGNFLYTIQFSGLTSQYDEYNETAQQMISSFKFT
jgi:hypothetical protein